MRGVILAIIMFLNFASGCSSGGHTLRTLMMPPRSGQAKIIGRILDDATLEEIPFATVTLQGAGMITSSDKDGFFAFDNVRPTTYSLLARGIGYYDTTLLSVTTSPDSIRTVLILMHTPVRTDPSTEIN